MSAVKEEICHLKIFLFLALVAILLRGADRFVQFWYREYYEELFYEIILNFCQWLRKRCHLKDISISSSGGHFAQGSKSVCAIYEAHFCETIFNLGQWLRNCLLKMFLFFSSGGHFVW